MTKRPLALAAVTLSAMALGTAPAAHAQSEPPDDTPLGPLDETDLGEPLDETNQPTVDNPAPATPLQAPTGPGGASPPGAAPPPVINLVINVPASPNAAQGRAEQRRRSASRQRKAARKRRLARQRRARQERVERRRRLAHRHIRR
jgi:hypothetical protein